MSINLNLKIFILHYPIWKIVKRYGNCIKARAYIIFDEPIMVFIFLSDLQCPVIAQVPFFLSE